MTKISFWMAVLTSQIVSVGFAAETRVVNGQTLYKDERPNSKLWCTKPWEGDKCPGQAGEISGSMQAAPAGKDAKTGTANKTQQAIRDFVMTMGPAGNAGGAVENCYFPPCTAESSRGMYWPASGLPVGSRLTVVDATGATVDSSVVQPDGSLSIPPPQQNVSSRGKGPYKICILHPQTPVKCGPVGAAQLQAIGGTYQLPRPMPTRPNSGSK